MHVYYPNRNEFEKGSKYNLVLFLFHLLCFASLRFAMHGIPFGLNFSLSTKGLP